MGVSKFAFTAGGAPGSVTLGAIALSKANDAQDENATQRAQTAALQAQIAAQNLEIERLQRSLNAVP